MSMARCISCGAALRYSLMGGFCDSAICSARERERERINAAARRTRTAAMLIRSERTRWEVR